MNEGLQSLWKIYETTSELVRFADNKASAILATLTVAASVLLPGLPTLDVILQQSPLLLVPGGTGAGLGILSFYYAVRTLLPASSVQITDRGSVIFFGEIARSYPRPADYETEIRQLFQDDAQITAQVSRQVWAVSRIAAQKYHFVNRSILLFAIAGFLGLVTIIARLFV